MILLPKNKQKPIEMSVEEYKKSFVTFALPKKKWGQPTKSPTMRAECPESALQKFANDLLELKRYPYLRFPDGFLGWIKMNAPRHIAAIFFSVWGGRPDNPFFIDLGGGYKLAVYMELKTQDKKGRAVGQLHGRQKKNAKEEQWFIARSTREIEQVIESAEAVAKKLRKIIDTEPSSL